MPSLRIGDMPDEVYEALAERARLHRRSLAQQAVADLARIPELEARHARQAVIEWLRASKAILPPKALDPVEVIRKDRMASPARLTRGQALVRRLRGRSSVRMSTDEILALTRK